MKKKVLTFTLNNPKYECPRHGTIEEVLSSTISGLKGNWCLRCYVEWVNKNIPRVKEIEVNKCSQCRWQAMLCVKGGACPFEPKKEYKYQKRGGGTFTIKNGEIVGYKPNKPKEESKSGLPYYFKGFLGFQKMLWEFKANKYCKCENRSDCYLASNNNRDWEQCLDCHKPIELKEEWCECEHPNLRFMNEPVCINCHKPPEKFRDIAFNTLSGGFQIMVMLRINQLIDYVDYLKDKEDAKV